MDLKERVLEGELMDAPDLDRSRHHRALAALGRVNWLSGTAAVVSRAIAGNFRKASLRRLKILDLACGGGDVSVAVGRSLMRQGYTVEIEAWDRSLTAIEFAERNRARQLPFEIVFRQKDVLELANEHEYDVVMCTLFLHHLTWDEAGRLLAAMVRSSRGLVLVDDLRRTWLGYGLAQLACRVLTRSPIVHVDGPLSVRAAFTESELKQLSREIGISEPRCVRHWPQRFLASWERILNS